MYMSGNQTSINFKNEIFGITKDLFGDVVSTHLSTKFGINSLDGFQENDFYGQ